MIMSYHFYDLTHLKLGQKQRKIFVRCLVQMKLQNLLSKLTDLQQGKKTQENFQESSRIKILIATFVGLFTEPSNDLVFLVTQFLNASTAWLSRFCRRIRYLNVLLSKNLLRSQNLFKKAAYGSYNIVRVSIEYLN